MTSRKRLLIYAIVGLLLPLALLVLPWSRPRPVQQRSAPETPAVVPSVIKPLPGSRNPWTLAEARAALKRQPDDGYLQFVVLQLATQQDRLAEVRHDIPLFAESSVDLPRERFGIWLSPDAAQQRLQADALLASEPNVEPAAPTAHGPTGGRLAALLTRLQPPRPTTLARPVAAPAVAVSVNELPAPVLPSRAWPRPSVAPAAVSPLALAVPADWYLAEFRSLDRLVAVLDAGRTWLGVLSVQADQDATSRPVAARLQRQLAIQIDDRALVPLVGQVALAGSDPYLIGGSDLTLLVQLRPDAVDAFRSRAERSLQDAAAQPGAGRSVGHYRGIDYAYVATADHRINAYAVTLPAQRLHLRTNSRVALERVLDVVLAGAASVGKSAEYQAIRTQLQPGAGEEDGLLFTPEALQRRLVGPAWQLTAARRRIGYNHLRMIGHAAQLYRTQFAKAPKSLDDLTRTGCAPGSFNQGRLASPFGGIYTLSADGVYGLCSVLGTADNLTPCCDLLVKTATAEEATDYRSFVDSFDHTTRLWLAPVALRLQTGPRQTRVEGLFVPPADDALHAKLTQFVGGAVEPLDALPVPARCTTSLSLRINTEGWLAAHASDLKSQRLAAATQLGLELTLALPGAAPWPALLAVSAPAWLAPTDTAAASLSAFGVEPAQLQTVVEQGLGSQASLHLYDTALPFDLSLPTAVVELLRSAGRRELGEVLPLFELGALPGLAACPAYVAVPVKDAATVDRFLTQLDAGLAKQVPTWRDGLFGMPIQGEFYHLTSKAGVAVRSLGVRAGPARYRLFWARLGDGLYLANQAGILDDLQAATTQRGRSLKTDRGPVAHALLKLRPSQVTQGLPGQQLAWAEANREACIRNLNLLAGAARAFSFTPPVSTVAFDAETRERLVLKYAGHMHGCACACPDGGRYTLADDGKSFVCSVHGSAAVPRQLDRPAPGFPAASLGEVALTLTRTAEGWRVVLTLTRR